MFDKIIDLHVQGREHSICRAALHRPEGNQAIIYDDYDHFGCLLDVMEQYTDVAVTDRRPGVETPLLVRDAVDRLALTAKYVAIHCTAANDAPRHRSVEGWRAIAKALRSTTDIDAVEIALEPMVAGPAAAPVRDLCGALALPEMAEVIRRAVLFVGIDSGLAHVADAVGTPGVILLGAYRGFGRYIPYSGDYQSDASATFVYEAASLSQLGPTTVIEAIRGRLTTVADRVAAKCDECSVSVVAQQNSG